MNLINTAVGFLMMYLVVHFLTIQFVKTWEQRSVYEKVVTIGGITALLLLFIGAVGGTQ